MSKRVYSLKHAPFLNKVHMNFMMSAREQLADHQAHYVEPICPRCKKPRGNRPLWMVGKFDECLECYESMIANGEKPVDVSQEQK